jgi:hypothetical protein
LLLNDPVEENQFRSGSKTTKQSELVSLKLENAVRLFNLLEMFSPESPTLSIVGEILNACDHPPSILEPLGLLRRELLQERLRGQSSIRSTEELSPVVLPLGEKLIFHSAYEVNL